MIAGALVPLSGAPPKSLSGESCDQGMLLHATSRIMTPWIEGINDPVSNL